TTHGGELAAVAVADLVPDQAANHRAGGGAGHAVGVARVAAHLDLLADHAAAVIETAALVLRPIAAVLRARAGPAEPQRYRRHRAKDPGSLHGCLRCVCRGAAFRTGRQTGVKNRADAVFAEVAVHPRDRQAKRHCKRRATIQKTLIPPGAAGWDASQRRGLHEYRGMIR